MHRHRRLLYYIRRTCICSMFFFCFFFFLVHVSFVLFHLLLQFLRCSLCVRLLCVCDCRLPFCWHTQYYLSSIIWTYIIVYNRECMVGTFFYLFICFFYFILFYVFVCFFHIFNINWWMTRSTTSTGRGKHKSSACHSHRMRNGSVVG